MRWRCSVDRCERAALAWAGQSREARGTLGDPQPVFRWPACPGSPKVGLTRGQGLGTQGLRRPFLWRPGPGSPGGTPSSGAKGQHGMCSLPSLPSPGPSGDERGDQPPPQPPARTTEGLTRGQRWGGPRGTGQERTQPAGSTCGNVLIRGFSDTVVNVLPTIPY